MTVERVRAISKWLEEHCPQCANNDSRGTQFVNCQAEGQKIKEDAGIACMLYKKYKEVGND